MKIHACILILELCQKGKKNKMDRDWEITYYIFRLKYHLEQIIGVVSRNLQEQVKKFIFKCPN